MNIAGLCTAQHGRPECSIPHELQFHAAADGLRDTVCPTQGLHLHCILRLAPGDQTGFEGVCGGGDFGLRGGRTSGGGEGDVVAESVGETGG